MHNENIPERMDYLVDKFGWEMPPVGERAEWNPEFFIKQEQELHDSIKDHFNVQTLFVWLGLASLLKTVCVCSLCVFPWVHHSLLCISQC